MKRDQLSLCVKRARAMGLSYGKYMALQETIKPSPPPKPKADLMRSCSNCGEIFFASRDSQIYCCKTCSDRGRNRRKSTRRRKKLAFQRAVREILEKERSGNI